MSPPYYIHCNYMLYLTLTWTFKINGLSRAIAPHVRILIRITISPSELDQQPYNQIMTTDNHT